VAGEQEAHAAVVEAALVEAHGEARVLVAGELDEGVAVHAAHDVHAALGDLQAGEELAHVGRARRPGQVLQPDDDRHVGDSVQNNF